MPNPTFGSVGAAASVASGVTTVAVAQPAGLAVGDLVALFCWSASTTTTWSATGFTSRAATANTGSAILTRVIDGTESWPITATRATSTVGLAGVVAVRVTNAGGVADAVTSASAVITSITASGLGAYLLQFETHSATGADVWTPPASATQRYTSTATGTATVCSGGDEMVGAGATGTRTWTHTAGGGVRSAMIAISPIVGPTVRKVRVAGVARTVTRKVRVGGVATTATRKVRVVGAPV